MKIMAPINCLKDMQTLASLGAEEFYCGLPPVDTSTVINRQDAYLADNSEAVELIRFAGENGYKIFFTLNMFYTPEILDKVLTQLETVAEFGTFGLIVSDVSLMSLLHQRYPGILLVASVLGHTLNSRSVKHYLDAGCRRVILGTHLTLSELTEIRSDLEPDVELEVLILNAGCFYEDGFCSFEHRFVKSLKRDSMIKSLVHRTSMTLLDHGPRFFRQAFYSLGPDYNPCCLRQGQVEVKTVFGKKLPRLEKAAVSFLSMERFKHKCGLCSMYRLHQADFSSIKIVGREKTLGEKKRDFQMVNQALGYLSQAKDEEDYKRYCRGLFQQRNGFDCGESFCYYVP